jgi:MEMO1 family protein
MNIIDILKKYSLILLLPLLFVWCASREPQEKIKKSNLAGSWYPAAATELSGQIDTLLAGPSTVREKGEALALVLPHAGYIYSGKTAAAGYRILSKSARNGVFPGVIVILGPSHYSAFHGCALLDADYYETPLGRVKLGKAAADTLHDEKLFSKNREAFEREHSIEIQLPFLQRIYGDKLNGDIQVLPILVGDLSDADASQAADKIAAAVAGRAPVFIVSSDLTHYGPNFGYAPFPGSGDTAASLARLDSGAIDFILNRDLHGFSGYVEKTGITICGRNPIRIALALPVSGFKALRIAYDTSGRITGDYTNSVSYAAIIISGSLRGATADSGADPFTLSADEKKFLLKIARDNLRSWFTQGKGIRIFPTDLPKNCLEKRGVFVTLKKGGSLRGCIGFITGIMPLAQAVMENSYNAAFKDPRFKPLAADELKDIVIDISVLTEPRLTAAEDVKPGRDGIIIERGPYRGVLLPQVASEEGWDRETFLDHTCLKAGLPAGAWKDGVTKIFRFQAIVFSEGGK